MRMRLVAPLVAFACIVPASAHASGDIFGDTAPSPSFGGASSGKDGFHDLNKIYFSGAWAGIVLSTLYDVPYIMGLNPPDFRGLYWYGATAGTIATGFGIATLVDGATVHDGVGGIVFGSVATSLGAFALVTSIYRLAQPNPSHDAMPAAAFVLDRSRLRIGQPSPTLFAGRF